LGNTAVNRIGGCCNTAAGVVHGRGAEGGCGAIEGVATTSQ